MISRDALHKIDNTLSRQAAVALIGPRQVGKTTLALQLAESRPSLYLDLESKTDRDKLSDPELFLRSHEDQLVWQHVESSSHISLRCRQFNYCLPHC
jgi:uncharacterized protein